MKLNRFYSYLVLGTVAVLAMLAFWRRGSEQRMRRAIRETPSQQQIQGPKASEAPLVSRTRRVIKLHRPGGSSAEPSAEPKDDLPEGIQSWEGKQKRDYTWEERQEVGLTNEKLFASAGAANWSVLAANVRHLVDAALAQEMLALSESYSEAAYPYAPDDPEENLQKERELLSRLERAVKPEAINEEGRQSYENLKRHVEMWNNGEAEKLVDMKIERENDAAKRLALSARNEADEGKDVDNAAEDGNK
jgi:hypothetical protein